MTETEGAPWTTEVVDFSAMAIEERARCFFNGLCEGLEQRLGLVSPIRRLTPTQAATAAEDALTASQDKDVTAAMQHIGTVTGLLMDATVRAVRADVEDQKAGDELLEWADNLASLTGIQVIRRADEKFGAVAVFMDGQVTSASHWAASKKIGD